MAVFSKDEYAAEKRKCILGCASGNFPRLSQLETLRVYGGELAESDFDLAVLEIDVKTRHFKKKTSKSKAVKMLSELRTCEPEQKSEYAKTSVRAMADYVSACESRSKHRKIALVLCLVFAVLLLGGGMAGLWYADSSGLLYGVGTVSFSADGKTYSQAAVQYNDYVSLRIPDKAGYDVVGVVDTYSGEMLFDEEGVSKAKVEQRNLSDYSDCNLEVVSKPHVYAATIRTASGVAATAFEFTVEDSPEDVLEEPQHLEGYIFDGWFTDASYKKPFSGKFKDYIDEPLVLYPHYSLDDWTITWDLQGGEMVGKGVDNYTILTDVILPKGDVVKRRGYEFVGWAVNGKIVEYFPATNMQDITLVAVWQPQVYRVTYQANGGELEYAEEEFTIEESLILQTPTRSAYQFDGWYTSKSYQTKVTEIEVGTTGDLTVYAKWTPITYHIDYELDGGENSPLNPTSYTVENRVKLLEPKKTGYRFDGWYNVYSGEYKSDLSAIDDGDVTLVATWTAKEYTITVCPDNGQPIAKQTVTYGSYYCITAPTIRGYELCGLTLGEAEFAAVGAYLYDFDAVVVAHYDARKYQISYVSEQSTIYTQTVTYGQPYTLYTPATRANYEFTGWRDNAVDGKKVCDGIFENDTNIVLYASWMKVLTINLESGKEYTVDKTIEKVYVIGNYSGASDNLMTDICITVSMRDTDLTMNLIRAGFRGKENRTAIDCENSSYSLTILLSGNSFIEGGKGRDGKDGKSGSAMNESNRNGENGQDGGHALNCGTVIFEEAVKNSSLTLKGGSGGNGGNGGVDWDRSRMWLNYTPNGGAGANSASALHCVSYSTNGTTVSFEKGEAGKGGKAGSRGDWWCAACYGSDGKAGTQSEAVTKK